MRWLRNFCRENYEKWYLRALVGRFGSTVGRLDNSGAGESTPHINSQGKKDSSVTFKQQELTPALWCLAQYKYLSLYLQGLLKYIFVFLLVILFRFTRFIPIHICICIYICSMGSQGLPQYVFVFVFIFVVWVRKANLNRYLYLYLYL